MDLRGSRRLAPRGHEERAIGFNSAMVRRAHFECVRGLDGHVLALVSQQGAHGRRVQRRLRICRRAKQRDDPVVVPPLGGGVVAGLAFEKAPKHGVCSQREGARDLQCGMQPRASVQWALLTART